MNANYEKLLDDALARWAALFADIDAVPTSVLIAEYVRCFVLDDRETEREILWQPAPRDDQKRITALTNRDRIAVEIDVRVPRRICK